jgi:hypothetical protein
VSITAAVRALAEPLVPGSTVHRRTFGRFMMPNGRRFTMRPGVIGLAEPDAGES